MILFFFDRVFFFLKSCKYLPILNSKYNDAVNFCNEITRRQQNRKINGRSLVQTLGNARVSPNKLVNTSIFYIGLIFYKETKQNKNDGLLLFVRFSRSNIFFIYSSAIALNIFSTRRTFFFGNYYTNYHNRENDITLHYSVNTVKPIKLYMKITG